MFKAEIEIHPFSDVHCNDVGVGAHKCNMWDTALRKCVAFGKAPSRDFGGYVRLQSCVAKEKAYKTSQKLDQLENKRQFEAHKQRMKEHFGVEL